MADKVWKFCQSQMILASQSKVVSSPSNFLKNLLSVDSLMRRFSPCRLYSITLQMICFPIGKAFSKVQLSFASSQSFKAIMPVSLELSSLIKALPFVQPVTIPLTVKPTPVYRISSFKGYPYFTTLSLKLASICTVFCLSEISFEFINRQRTSLLGTKICYLLAMK